VCKIFCFCAFRRRPISNLQIIYPNLSALNLSSLSLLHQIVRIMIACSFITLYFYYNHAMCVSRIHLNRKSVCFPRVYFSLTISQVEISTEPCVAHFSQVYRYRLAPRADVNQKARKSHRQFLGDISREASRQDGKTEIAITHDAIHNVYNVQTTYKGD